MKGLSQLRYFYNKFHPDHADPGGNGHHDDEEGVRKQLAGTKQKP